MTTTDTIIIAITRPLREPGALAAGAGADGGVIIGSAIGAGFGFV